MALIDEYKQAIQDVLDGRMKEAPRPSELPWTEDKAATMWAAAAAELIAEDSAGGGGGDDSNIEYVRFSHQSSSPAWVCDHTVAEMEAAYQSGKTIVGIKEQTAYDGGSWSLSTGERGSATAFEFNGFCYLSAPGGVYFLRVNRITVSNDTVTVLTKSVQLS